MFSTANHFQMFKPGRINGRHGTLQIQSNQSKASEQHQTLLNGLDWEWQMQQDEYYSTYSLL